jgi:hypothetical protein
LIPGRRAVRPFSIAILVLAAATLSGCLQPAPQPRAEVRPARSPAPAQGAAASVYLHYYLWWTPQHWRDKLGPLYPLDASPLPLPGTADSSGCNPRAAYRGATIVDIPTEGLYNQQLAETFDRHIALAADAGVRGFLASWKSTGQPGQEPSSSGYNQRLDLLVSRVEAYNRSHSRAFGLALAMAAYGDYQRPADATIADLKYFASRYGAAPAFSNGFSKKPLVMWLDSRKFAVETVREVSAAVADSVYLVGDETARSWARDAAYLEGTSYYWSTESPDNGNAQATLTDLGGQVRAAGKTWFAPFIPGYDKQLVGGSCVPRNGTRTLDRIWAINAASHPDGWFGISWNELVENTHLEPTATYGATYLDELKRLIAGVF